MKQIKYIIGLFLSIGILSFSGCTNLDETVYSEIVGGNYYKTGDDVLAAYLAVYGPIQEVWDEDYFNIVEFSTDEASRPTKVGHGYDGGIWIRLHRHEWVVTESRIETVWNQCYKGIGFANKMLADLPDLDFKALKVSVPKSQMEAELRAMRAFYHMILIDLYGGVPIATKVEAESHPRDSRTDVFDFIDKELNAAIPNLIENVDKKSYGKMTQGAAWALLARLYLNAEEWTGTPRWKDCIDACDEVITPGRYDLDDHWQDPFHYDNEKSKENIFVIVYDQVHAKQQNYATRILHYAHQDTYDLGQTPSNGICTEIGFYSKYKSNDKRIDQWLVGPQFRRDGVTPLPCVMELAPNQLVLNPVIESMEEGAENSGVRNVKFKILVGTQGNAFDNDVPIVRYADVLMMKAESLLRTGKKDKALPLINDVRARAFKDGDVDKKYDDITLDEFLDERGREFAYECLRRQDLIRFGKFNDAWWDKKASDETRKLFPIPDARIKANPKMKQNPGYSSSKN